MRSGESCDAARSTEARVEAQAKINLHLRVLAREASGFHSIETIFHKLDLADVVTVRLAPRERSITCTGADTGTPEQNLAYRAAMAYAEHAPWLRGFHIEIAKAIPVGAGLGGGSADAAAVLRALNEMRPPAAAAVDILHLAASLGSDVPFLASDAVMALARGRGERMTALPPLSARRVVLVVPSFAVATAAAYGWLAADRSLTQRSGSAPEPLALAGSELDSWGAIARIARNDLAVPVEARHPEIRQARSALAAAGAELAMMTGSGSVAFGIMPAGWTGALPPGGYCGSSIVTRTASRVVRVELTR